MIRLILLIDFTETYATELLRGILDYSQSHEPWVICRMPPSYRVEHGIEGVLQWARQWKADAIIGQFNNNDDVSVFAENGIIALAQDFIQRFQNIPNIRRIAHFAGCFFCIRCSIAQIAGWLYSEYSKSLYTFAMQSEA